MFDRVEHVLEVLILVLTDGLLARRMRARERERVCLCLCECVCRKFLGLRVPITSAFCPAKSENKNLWGWKVPSPL